MFVCVCVCVCLCVHELCQLFAQRETSIPNSSIWIIKETILDDILIDVRPSVCGAVISRNISRVISSKPHFSRAVIYPHV